MNNIKEVDDLYRTKLQLNIKKAFDIFESSNFSLKDIIKYVILYHSKEKYDYDLPEYLSEKEFIIGPLLIKFYMLEDYESLDIDTYYVMNYSVSLLSENNEVLKVNYVDDIHTTMINTVFPSVKKNELIVVKTKVEEATWDIFKDLDKSRVNELYQCLVESFNN